MCPVPSSIILDRSVQNLQVLDGIVNNFFGESGPREDSKGRVRDATKGGLGLARFAQGFDAPQDGQNQTSKLATIGRRVDVPGPLGALDAPDECFFDGVEGLLGPGGHGWIAPRQLGGSLG
jgi:hypothetical protein